MQLFEGMTSTGTSNRVSLIHRLPVELLSEIFVEYLKRPHWADNPQCLPLLLTHVCHRWKQCAVATPKLWRNVDITSTGILTKHDFQLAVQKVKDLTNLMEMYVSRSGALPLNLSFKMGGHPSKDIDDCLHAWRRWMNRAESVSLTATTGMIAVLFQSPLRLPFLRKLSLQLDGEAMGACISFAPRWPGSDCVLRGNPSVCRGDEFSWAQVTRLSLQDAVVEESLLDVLEQCTSLRSLDIRFTQINCTATPILPLANLECLTISFWDDKLAFLLPLISAPALRELSLTAYRWGDPDVSILYSLATMIAASRCPLEKLCLQCPGIVDSGFELAQVLDPLQSLRELHISGDYSTRISGSFEEVFCALAPCRDPIATAVPCLETLSIKLTIKEPNGFPADSSISTILDARRTGRSCIKLENAKIVLKDYSERRVWRVIDGKDIVREVQYFPPGPMWTCKP